MPEDEKENARRAAEYAGAGKRSNIVFGSDNADDDWESSRSRRRVESGYEEFEDGVNAWAQNAPAADAGASPLSELQCLALREARALEGQPPDEAVIFEPPNSPRKRPIDFLKELACVEACRMHRKSGRRMHDGEVAVPEEASPALPPRARRYRPKSNDDEIVYDGVVRSFNDFDEGIFVFNGDTGMYKCPDPQCSKEFPSLSRIKRHFITHTNIKPFKCENKECNRTFSRKDNMLQHYRIHCPYSNDNK